MTAQNTESAPPIKNTDCDFESNAEPERLIARMPMPTRLEGPTMDRMRSVIMWMPAGTHRIHATLAGQGPVERTMVIDADAAQTMQDALLAATATGHRALIDFDHAHGAAAGWPTRYWWEEGRGVMVDVEWSEAGAAAIAGRSYRAFSPEFFADAEGRVTGAPKFHGGLVNDPAFEAMEPLWAARANDFQTAAAPADAEQSKTNPNMNEEEKNQTDGGGSKSATVETKPEAAPVQASNPKPDAEQAPAAKPDAALQAKLDQANAALAAMRKEKAQQAVQAAVARGALPALDTEMQARWTALIEKDESHRSLLDALPGSGTLRASTTGGGVAVQARPGVLDALRAMHAETDPTRRGVLYRDVRSFVAQQSGDVLPLLAANALGTLAGDLIVQRALDLLKLSFPVLGAITTDFSAEQARQGQTIKTRVISVPSVVTLNDTTGWASSDATATDVTVTIGQPKGVQIEYGSSELAKTNRNLFDEQVQASHYALAKDLVDALYGLIVIATYTHATTKSLASLARADLVAMEKALAERGVDGERHLLLNANAYEKMSNDTTLLNLATQQKAEMITGTGLPPIAGFNVIRAVNLPSTGNLLGFGFRRDAFVAATRLPEDYTRAIPGAGHGMVSVVTNPDVGVSVQKVDFVDHKLAKAISRIAWAYGVSAGNPLSGQILKSA